MNSIVDLFNGTVRRFEATLIARASELFLARTRDRAVEIVISIVVEEDGVGVHFLFLDSRNKTFLRTAIDSISYWVSLCAAVREHRSEDFLISCVLFTSKVLDNNCIP